jgi:hypothetical protein
MCPILDGARSFGEGLRDTERRPRSHRPGSAIFDGSMKVFAAGADSGAQRDWRGIAEGSTKTYGHRSAHQDRRQIHSGVGLDTIGTTWLSHHYA